jgi:hypothetical protein
MRRARWCTSLLVLGLLALAAPAAAHETGFGDDWWLGSAHHAGWFQPSPESRSKNAEIIGSVTRTRRDQNYRNSDLAFWGDLAYAGHYDGFQIVDVSNPRQPKQVVDHPCPGSQHDVSVWRNLLFVSVEAPRSGPECTSTAMPPRVPGFEGIRIFDVSNPRNPVLIKGVPTDCGSHTHTLVPDIENGRVLLYVASYTSTEFAVSPYGNVCDRIDENGERAHNKISVVGVPLNEPRNATVVSEPRFEQNDRANTPGYQGCHDITVYMQIERAAAACMTEGQIWDISDKANPTQIARVHNPNVEFFHSAAFSWDGRTVIFGDEAGGGTQARCRPQDADTLGALWFYDVGSLDVTDSSTVEPALSSWKVPRDQVKVDPEQELEPNCTMHNFNTLPTLKRDVLVSSAYAAGTTMIDFSDARNPKEVAHVDPHGANTWSSYWYNGYIVTNDGGRGVDVMRVKDERADAPDLRWSNPQTQDAVLR